MTNIALSLVGQHLDHFHLQEFVGGGGMGVVFKALDTRLNRIVALKVLSRDQADEEEKVRRFQNEAQSAARLDHDHIARVYFVGQDRGLHYIVFEYIEGVNLRDLVARKGPLPLDEAISYTVQVAEALAHAASRDVVHRDIKPSNVLITAHGRAKLVDMGLARLHQVDPAQNELTSSGVTLGTFDYISPEQARDPRGADVRSDIYSLGCTLYYMLTARPPFPEGNVLQKLLQHSNDPPPDPAEYSPDLPEQVSRLVSKMLAKDPRKRHQTAGELVADLLVLIDQLGLPAAGVDPQAWTVATPPRISFIERHLPWAVPIVVLIAAVVAIDFAGRGDAQTADIGARPYPPRLATGALNAEGEAQPDGQHQTVPDVDGNVLPRTALIPASEVANNGNGERRSTQRDVPAATTNINDRSLDNITSSSPPKNGSVADVPAATVQATPAEGTVTDAAASNPLEGSTRPMPAGVLVVNPWAEGPNVYHTLRQALAAEMASGDVIELHFNGRLEERPLRLNNRKLTIRAGEGYSPTLVFVPRDPLTSDPQAMLTAVGGQLNLFRVALEVEISPRLDPPSWTLFQLQRTDMQLDRCWLTVRNATPQGMSQHPFVSFFDVKASPDSSRMAMDNSPITERFTEIHLENCIVRGEATMLRSDDLQPVGLTWRNGLLATSERLLAVQSGEMANRTSGQISIDLRHVTAHVRSGLCLLTNEGTRPLMHTEVQCTNSILMASADAPLIEQSGINSVADFEGQLEWSGDHYFYTGFSNFWRISSFGPNLPAQDPTHMPFDQWQSRWNERSTNPSAWSRVIWKRLPDATRPLHTHTPADYALDEMNPDNQARVLGATDGEPAGLQSRELPPLPRDTLATSPAPPTSASAPQPEDEL